MKKILITGANGMIGSALCREFINKYELIMIDAFTNRIDKYAEKATIIREDFTKIEKWEDILDSVYCVVHLAAAVHWIPKTNEEEKQFIKINTEGTRMLYDICSKQEVKKFLFFSTNDVYKSSEKLITENMPADPQGIYEKSKYLAEQYLLEMARTNQTAVCVFRPASVYGENDKGSMKSLITLCRKGIVPMLGDGSNKKSLLYLKDLLMVVEKYIENENNLNGEIFNISSGDFGYKEIIDTICKCYVFRPLRINIPNWFCQTIASNINSLKKLTVASETKVTSNDKAYKLLGYERKYDLNNGLKDAKSYYVSNRK